MAANNPALFPDQEARHHSDLQAEWERAQAQCRKDLRGVNIEKSLRFNTVDELHAGILNTKEAQTNTATHWLGQLKPYLDIMQLAFLILAAPVPSLKLETKLFFGLLYLIISGAMRSTEVLGKFTEALKRVSNKLQLLNRYGRRLVNDSDVQSYIVDALIELISLWVKASELFTSQRSLLGTWSNHEAQFEAAEMKLDNYVKAVADIAQVEAAFGKANQSSSDPFKMLLQGEEDDDLFPLNTLDRDLPPFFTRHDVVDKIDDFMKPSPSPNEPLRKYVLSGLGGSGKTTTALAYAHKARKEASYDAIFWVGSQTAAQIDQTFMKIALKLNLPMNEMTKDPAALKLRIRTWLDKTKLAREIQAQGLYELASLDAEHSLAMFQGLRQIWSPVSINNRPADEEIRVQEFLCELDGLPLAIEQMAAYASFTEKSIEELHQEFSKSFKRIAAGVKKKRWSNNEDSETSTMTLATVWDLQFAEIRGTIAGHILGLLSILSPDSIPKNLLTPEEDWDDDICDIVVAHVDEEVLENASSSPEDAIGEALDLLKQLALVKSTSGYLSVHRLVQKAFLHPKISSEREDRTRGRPQLGQLDLPAIKGFIDTVCKLLDYRFPRADKGDQTHWGKWKTCAMYMPHVESVVRHFGSLEKRLKAEGARWELCQELQDLVQNSAWYQYELGDYHKCLELVHFGQKHTARDSDMYAHFSSHAACAYFELHEVAKGQEQIDTALSIRERTRDPDDSQLGNAYSNKAILEYSVGRYESAKAYNAKAYRIRQITKDNYLSAAHFHLGVINMLQGHLDDAEKELRICGDFCRKACVDFADIRHPSQLLAAANVALKRGNAETAKMYLTEGRTIVSRDMPMTLLAAAYEYRLGKHFDDSIELANRRGVESETARALRMKAVVYQQKHSGIDPGKEGNGDLVKAAEEILGKFQAREQWDLSGYEVEERYDMMVCGHRR
ncbi:hypothetical protein NW762_006379 [Fusarium torreyae]|uniref:NB-ARC domain-containing protein n=1 Tax=Fusarium torreyae TaxID=1237075 RepID=A0A9W8S1H7_9HYPO|nr:hypothetical protein NW762_006379 [Fusarium torreyae]